MEHNKVYRRGKRLVFECNEQIKKLEGLEKEVTPEENTQIVAKLLELKEHLDSEEVLKSAQIPFFSQK